MVKKQKEKKPSKFSIWLSRWQRFHFASFRKDFNLTTFYWQLSLVSVFILFHQPIKEFFNILLVKPLISFSPESLGADFVFGVYFLLSIAFFIRQIRMYLIPTINSVVFVIVISVIYFIFFKNTNDYKFYHYTLSFVNGVTYSTSFIYSTTLIVISYKSFLKPLSKEISKYFLLDDSPSPEKYIDLYSREGYASLIASHILGTSTDVSFAIAIVGDWGSGKSDLMLRLKRVLAVNTENLVCDFNPWRVNKPDGIIDEFFKTLSKELKHYDQSISQTIRDYSGQILKPARETQFKFIDALIRSWFKEDDIQEKYDAINNSIKATSKRIVIFIDDVDRLTGKEVMEVLRIIRNTANFSNTFFIVGLDQNYIVNVLKNTKDFSNEEEYLKKVFQLTITLPAFKKDNFLAEIRRILFTPDLEERYRKKLLLALSHIGSDADDSEYNLFFPSFHHEFLLDKMISNVRDLKRLCNSFKIVFNILKDEAEISDLFVLELIRNKNIVVYNSIRNRSILMINPDSSSQLKLDEEKWNTLQEDISELDQEGITRALDFLFSDKQFKNQRKVILAHNFYIYFSYQLFNLISLHEFNQTLAREPNEILLVFEKWIKELKDKELSQIFTFIDDFNDANELKKVVTVLLRMWTPNSDWYEHAKILVFVNWKYNHERYFESDNSKQKDFLCSILEDESIDLFTRARLANEFLKGIIEGTVAEAELFISKKELRNISYHLFDEYLNSNPDDPYKTIEFYHLNEYKVVNGNVIYFPPVSRRFKNYLLNNAEGFKGYVKTLLRPSQIPYNGQLVLEPWIEQIFIDWKIFKEKLSNTNFNQEELSNLRKIILEYIDDFFTSGRKPIEIKNEDDLEFINKFLSLKKKADKGLASFF